MACTLGKDLRKQKLAQLWAERVPAAHACFAQILNTRKQTILAPALGSLIEGVGPFSIKPNARSPLYPVAPDAFELLRLSVKGLATVETSDAFVWGGARKVLVWQA